MKQLKMLVTGLVIGLCAGLWFGVNLGKDQPLYSNPFNSESLQQKAKRTADDVLEETKRVLRKSLD
ncbi:MAG: hypothetical protein GXP11_10575 [Gammaproteobacteria bacterium]|nr:hypothetical protein [Gammaproteobacteria bacterium]